MTIRSHQEIARVSGRVYTTSGFGYTYGQNYTIGESYVGGDNSSWLKAVKAGENATNPLNANKSFLEFRPIDMRGTVWLNPNQQSGTEPDGVAGYPVGLAPTMPDAVHSSSALADCVARFNQKLQEEMRPVQGLAFLGELGETIRMIKGTGRRLFKDIEKYVVEARRYLRSDYRSRKALKGLSDLWLEYSFGWTPLFFDIAGGVKILTQPRHQRKSIRAWGEDRSVIAWQSPSLLGLSSGYMQCFWSTRNTNVSSAQQVAALDFTLVGQPSTGASAAMQNKAERWGFTARQFIPSVWELIPYSFLIDYYVNIGDIIDSAFADRRAIAWGYQTQRTTAIRESRWWNGTPLKSAYNKVTVTSNTPGSIKVGTKRFTRVSNLTVIPPITVGYPDFGGLKYANQIALAFGRLRTR